VFKEISVARRWVGAAMPTAVVAVLIAVPVALAAPAGLASAASAGGLQSALPVVAPRAASRSIMFGGLTGQNWPVVVAISPNGRHLRLAVIGLRMSCTSGRSFAVEDAFGILPIGPAGNVHAAETIPSITVPNVTITGGSHWMKGVLHRRSAVFSGSWHLHLDYRFSDGTADHCDSGVVRFGAEL
jgi:hypothetical protein